MTNALRIFFLVLAICALSQAGYACAGTKAAFNKIAVGMTASEAERAVGCPGEIMQETESSGIRIVVYKWDGGDNLGSSLIVMTQDGRVINRSQFGLK